MNYEQVIKIFEGVSELEQLKLSKKEHMVIQQALAFLKEKQKEEEDKIESPPVVEVIKEKQE